MRRAPITTVLIVLMIATVLGAGAGVGSLRADDSSTPIAPGGPSLKTALEKGLRARRPVEFAFIKSVTDQVDEGTLPKSLVVSTFLWARNKRPYPYPYFERGLRERAKKLKLTVN